LPTDGGPISREEPRRAVSRPEGMRSSSRESSQLESSHGGTSRSDVVGDGTAQNRQQNRASDPSRRRGGSVDGRAVARPHSSGRPAQSSERKERLDAREALFTDCASSGGFSAVDDDAMSCFSSVFLVSA
jgi:hypothetical protein